ncbi:hypothetical protein, partial [Bradyrhizobium brasilense]|uniref:hypothetical protein n=1 Tax=Bradyrhizobium brasilense TaxID=1419277 RepID=UPI001E475C88
PTPVELARPAQPADGADGKNWTMQNDLTFEDILPLPEPERSEAAEMRIEGFIDSFGAYDAH